MNIDNLTIAELKQIAGLAASLNLNLNPAPVPTPKSDHPLEGHLVLVRTYSAGVHIGTLTSQKGTEVWLSQAVRLWSWQGAFTLNEVSQIGVAKGSRISRPVPAVLLTEAVEVIPVSTTAAPTLTPTE